VRSVVATALGLGLLATSACGTVASPNYGRDVVDVHDAGTIVPIDVVQSFDDVVIAPRDGGDARTGHGPPYPIVLHHGFAGFRDIGPVNYYYNVARDLRAQGETVYEAEVTPFNPPEVRAVELAHFIDTVLAETGSAKVILVAHSQGGLDSRYMISSLGYGDRVALLATIATPHRGTRIADAVLGNVPGLSSDFVDSIAELIGLAYNDARNDANVQATLRGLSEGAAADFNRANPDDPRVVYWSWSGRSNRRTGSVQCSGARFPNDPSMLDSTNVLLAPFAIYLEQNDPVAHVNDGMVEVQSAKWGLWMGCVPADHFDEVGQIANDGPDTAGWEHLAFYRDVVRLAHEAGF
jgi:triacylglycerol lipase